MINVFVCGIRILHTQRLAYSFLLIDDIKSGENDRIRI